MAAVKDLAKSAEKWTRRAQVAGPDYAAGVQNPRNPWSASAQAADGAYRAGVTAAAQSGKYGAGVKAVGDEKWRANSVAKGPARYAEGVAMSQESWQRGFTPFAAAIQAVNLPARGPVGSPQNLQRVALIANALRAAKERGAK